MFVETYRFHIGNFQCIAINDGYISNIPARSFFPNAPDHLLDQALKELGLTQTLSVPCICLVVDTGTHRVLLETGGGKGHSPYGANAPDTPRLQANLGHLMDGLEAEDIAPETIDTIILSHAHSDHISGNVDQAGNLLFPNARYFMARGEWEGLVALSIPDDDEEWDGWTGAMRLGQQQCLAIQDRVRLVDPEAEIVPGVCLIPTPGHTPNHCSIEFMSGDQRLVCPIDTTWLIAIEHPEWGPLNEHELESRRQIHARAGGATLVHGFHFPFPGLGTMLPDGEGWRWRPMMGGLHGPDGVGTA